MINFSLSLVSFELTFPVLIYYCYSLAREMFGSSTVEVLISNQLAYPFLTRFSAAITVVETALPKA